MPGKTLNETFYIYLLIANQYLLIKIERIWKTLTLSTIGIYLLKW